MTEAMTIPILPCISLSDTLTFYRALGFEVTHEQTRPNVYAATHRGDLQLHFMGIPKLEVKNAYSACLVLVPAIDALHSEFSAGLRGTYGKLPLRGIPRISRLRPGASRFTLVDVAGNSVIFVRQGTPDDYDDSVYEPTSPTPLGKALHAARRLRDFRNDDASAARVLDLALAKPDPGAPIDRARVLAARAEIALAQGDTPRARTLRDELASLQFSAADRSRYRHELEAPERIERSD